MKYMDMLIKPLLAQMLLDVVDYTRPLRGVAFKASRKKSLGSVNSPNNIEVVLMYLNQDATDGQNGIEFSISACDE